MHDAHKIIYKIEVYNIRSYLGGVDTHGYNGGIEGLLQKDATAEQLQNWFNENKHNALPDPESENGITRNALLDTYFKKITYDNLDTAKAEILKNTFMSTLATNCYSVDWYLREGNLIMACHFIDDAKADAVALALGHDEYAQVAGAVHSTVASV